VRTASTSERTDEIIGSLSGPKLSSVVEIAVKNNGIWETIEDVDEETGIDWDSKGMRFDYSAIPLVPEPSTVKFTVKNFDGKYSPGSGTAWADLLDADTRVRLRAGYVLSNFGEPSSQSIGIYFPYYFKMDGSSDQLNTVGNANTWFKDISPGLYGDGATYGDAHYGAYGYVIYRKRLSSQANADKINSVTVTAPNSGYAVYAMARNVESIEGHNSSDWTYLGVTTGGADTFPCSIVGQWAYIAIVRIGGTYGDTLPVTVSVSTSSKIEWIYYSIFHLDTPEFTDPPAPEMATVICSGRDIFKRAQETDFNFPDLSGGVAIDDAIKIVLDSCGIPYTTTSIDDLGAFAVRVLAVGLGKSEKGDSALEKLIQCTWQDGLPRYLAYVAYDVGIDENVFFFKQRPSVFNETNVFNYSNMENIGSRRKNYDKIIKRLGVFSKKESQDAEVSLGTGSYSTTGSKTISWSGNAEDKRIVYTITAGNPTIVLTDESPTSVSFTIDGTGSIDVEVFGCKWASTAPDSEGEWQNIANMNSGKGKTSYIENPLVIDSAEAKSIAKSFITDYANPQYEIGNLVSPYLNLLFDVLSTSLVWSKVNYIDTLFYITNVSHHWDRQAEPQQKTTYTLTDTGKTLADLGRITWDAGFKWDMGWVWDMMQGPRYAGDTTDYSYLKPIGFT